MKHLIKILILLLIPTGSLAHNMLYLDADSITSSTVLIRGVEPHSEMGVSNYFDLGSGTDLNIDVDLQSEGSCCSRVVGGFNSNSNSSLKIKIDGSGTNNRVELDYDYTGLSTHHHVDIDIDGSGGGTNAIYFDDGDADHSDTSLEIDIDGQSNQIYPTMGGTRQTAKIFIDGNNNLVYSWLLGTGTYAEDQTSLANLTAAQYNSYIHITGNDNYIRSKVKDASKTRLIIVGDDNKITEYGDRDDWLLNGDGTIYIDINGDNNLIGSKIQGWPAGGNGTSYITIDVDSDDVQIDVNQHGGGNTAEIKVYGDSNYDFVLDVHQSANHTFVMCFNRAHQNADYNGDFDSQNNHSETWNSSTIYSTGSSADCI